MRIRIATIAACALLAGVVRQAFADDYRITTADRTEVEELLHRFFDATRDGNTALAAQAIPTRAEFEQLFQPGTEPFVERHQRAVERDVRDLRARFAGGTFTGVASGFDVGSSIALGPCGSFGAPASECTGGPVIEWRVGNESRRLRIDRLVRIGGHWKIFDPRL